MPMFINTISVSNNISKQQNTITSQLLQYACVHLQLARGVWNLEEEREEMVYKVTANRKFMKGFEHDCKYRMGRRKLLDQLRKAFKCFCTTAKNAY